MNDNDYNEYIILDNDMVDISSKSEQKQGSDHKSRYSKKGKSKKKLILIISSVAAYYGYFSYGGALDVGKASTNAVVNSSILILFFNLLITNIMLN